jgi:hypothetical protein
MDVVEDARALLAARLQNLDEEEQRLRRVLDHLGGPGDPKRPPRSAVAKSQPRTKRRKASFKRASKGERRDQFMQCISDAGRDGITVGEISKKIGLSTPNSLHPVGKSLLRMGAVSKEGSRYYPVGVKPPQGTAKAAAKRGRPQKE